MIIRPWNPLPTGLSVDQLAQALNQHLGNRNLLWAQAVGFPVKTVAADYQVDGSDHTIQVDASSGPVIVTLPYTSQFHGGRYNVVKVDSSTNPVTTQAAGIRWDATEPTWDSTTVTFDLAPDVTSGTDGVTLTAQWDSVMLHSNGAGVWLVLSAA